MKAFEDATGEALDETKKEIASEELIITGSLGEEIGADKATGIVNEIKTEIIKNNTQDTTQIAETINNIVNNYDVTLNVNQQQQLEQLMQKIAEQDYDYKEMKNTLNGIKNTIEEKLDAIGEGIDRGFFENMMESVKGWLTGFGEWISGIFTNKEDNLGILAETNDALLGENAIIDATNEKAINLPSSEEVEGFFAKIWNWFAGLFKSNNSNKIESEVTDIKIQGGIDVDDTIESLEQNSIVEENVQIEDESNIEDSEIENNNAFSEEESINNEDASVESDEETTVE